MDGRDFLHLARRLAAETTEDAWRASVNRAYYAAFHVARQLLEDLGFTVPHADRAHGHLWLRLANCGHAQVQVAGTKLNDMRRTRNRADYELGRPLTQGTAMSAIQTAEQVIQQLDAARSEPTRTQILDAMKLYERDVLHDVTWHP